MRAPVRAERTPLARVAIWSVPALLVIALVLLVLGLVTSGSGWLAASLGCSVVAAVVLVLERFVLTPRRTRPESAKADPERSAATAAEPAPRSASDPDVAPTDAVPAPAMPHEATVTEPITTAEEVRHVAHVEQAQQAKADDSADRATSAEDDDEWDDGPAIDPDDPDAVWVVDGQPRYHRRGCAELDGLEAEPIPSAQAIEDGFVPCPRCEADSATAPS